jgi:chemotaxis protein methyltransferase CheR
MEVSEKDIRSFQDSIRDHSEYDFTGYSITSLKRRISKILLELDLTIGKLNTTLGSDPAFLEKIVRKLTVQTTELFRDPDIWKKIRTELLPYWKDRPGITIWHPGCSTGQEVYSMMMVLDELGMLEKTTIYGSDLNTDAIETARRGRYKYQFNRSYLENFDRVMLNGDLETPGHKNSWNRYFMVDETRDAIQMKEYLCSKPVYKKQDLVRDANLFLVKFDLIVCRNVIIYFNSELQNRVFDLFYANLNEPGVLWLGVHESIMGPWSVRFMKRGPFYFRQPV